MATSPDTKTGTKRRSVQPNVLVSRLVDEGPIQALDQSAQLYGGPYTSKLYTIILQEPNGATPGEVMSKPMAPSSDGDCSQESSGNLERMTIIVERKGTLGCGGFGVVNSALLETADRKIQTQICLKQSLHTDCKDTANSLVREAKNFMILEKYGRCDHIIKFLFCCAESGESAQHQVFMGLEYFKGDDLSACMHHHGKAFTYAQLIAILTGVTKAVAHLQHCGLIHCDIKPQNVMFNVYNNELKLIDFGCAVQVDDKSTEKLGGTSEYMAPEMIMKNGDPALNKTDIYGVGALLYRLITFERPWHHDEKLMNVRRKEGGGHHEAKWIIRDLLTDYLDMCFEKGDSTPTPLQTRLIDRYSTHCSKYPLLCALVCDMINFHPHKRPDADDIISRAEEIKGSVMRQASQVSMASSEASSSTDLENSLPVPGLLQSTSVDASSYNKDLHEKHRGVAVEILSRHHVEDERIENRGENAKGQGYADYGDDKEDVDNNKGEPMLHQPEGEDAVDDPDDDDNEEQQCEGSGVQDGNYNRAKFVDITRDDGVDEEEEESSTNPT